MTAQRIEASPQARFLRTPPRAPGWARILLALVAFEAAAFSSLLFGGIGSFQAWVVSDDPILKTGTLVVMWTVSCIAYLLFALMLTRYMDHRPVRAAGLVFNRRAAKALLVGTGISTVVICCVTAVSHVLGLVVPSPPMDLQVPWWFIVVSVLVVLARSYVFQGIGEEAIMRGYLLQSFSDRPTRAVWVSVIVFTIPHIISRGGQQNVLERVIYLAIPFGFALAATCLCLIMRSVWAGIGIHGGFHLATTIALIVGTNHGPVLWTLTGAFYVMVALVLASRISEQRWVEIAERGPYAPPAASGSGARQETGG